MAKGMSIHIGLNSVDPEHYGGWSGPLAACEFDAQDMKRIADEQGYESALLETAAATRDAVLGAIDHAAEKLTPGDILFLSYSGHGGQVPDWNGAEDEIDNQDETWCLYDKQLIDDELYQAWSKFREGVRIIVLSDSCHSGTMIRVMDESPEASMPLERVKAMPMEAAVRTYRKNRKFYDKLQDVTPSESESEIGASVMLISGCQDNQVSLDGTFNGKFTGTLLRVWRDGQFSGDYRDFHSRILARMPSTQSPNLFLVGQQNVAFERQKPFLV